MFLKYYLLKYVYIQPAQYNEPLVTMICNAINDRSVSSRNGILEKVSAGMQVASGNLPCYINPPTKESQEYSLGWLWQVYIHAISLPSRKFRLL